jgi:DNA-binding NarL/FixJ family response regulator
MVEDARRLLVVDDHEMLAQVLVRALRIEGISAARARSVEADGVLDEVREVRPDIVLLDLNLASGSALPLIAPLQALGSRVVMVTGEPDEVLLAECLEQGAIGVVSKASPFGELVEAVAAVVAGGSLVSTDEREDLLAGLRRHRKAEAARFAPFEQLTPRERQVLASLVEGRSPDAIAEQMFVSLATVRAQIRAIYSKLGVHSQLEAVACARAAGWGGA